ncbi:MAG: UDP-N-acetylmuramate dehydrogenase [Anaerolineales bacterium]
MANSTLPLESLRASFGPRLREAQPVARYTSARIGGLADALLDIESAEELVKGSQILWKLGVPFVVLGGGSNVLISDDGVREVVLLNQSSQVRFNENPDKPNVWAESGASLGAIARQAAKKGLGGLEWAAGIPGSLGGAVVGNAGAHGGDLSMVLDLATILHQKDGKQGWTARELAYAYRQSRIKTDPHQMVVLSAQLALSKKSEAEIQAQMDTFVAYRRLTQPPGASMGSMFKNPPGESAGRLIEAAGLKGKRIGNAQISPLHANFFLNLGDARAADVYALIQEARITVQQRFDVTLELEIELVGEWPQQD